MSEHETLTDAERGVSRRTFIKGVIAAGATASSATYLFRATSGASAAPTAQQAMGRMITLNVNGQQRRDFFAMAVGNGSASEQQQR